MASATSHMRDIIAELMGSATKSTGAAEGPRQTTRFSDSSVCRMFLLAVCPHDILEGTGNVTSYRLFHREVNLLTKAFIAEQRYDLGKCRRTHDLALRADYAKANEEKELKYEYEVYTELSAFYRTHQRKIDDMKKELLSFQEELSAEVLGKANKIHDLGEEIGKRLAEVERMGAEGQVEESLTLMDEVEKLKDEKRQAEIDFRSSMPSSIHQQQKLRVCEVCAAYLGIHDNDRRLADHFGGKLHMGFIEIKENLDKLEAFVKEKGWDECPPRIDYGGGVGSESGARYRDADRRSVTTRDADRSGRSARESDRHGSRERTTSDNRRSRDREGDRKSGRRRHRSPSDSSSDSSAGRRRRSSKKRSRRDDSASPSTRRHRRRRHSSSDSDSRRHRSSPTHYRRRRRAASSESPERDSARRDRDRDRSARRGAGDRSGNGHVREATQRKRSSSQSSLSSDSSTGGRRKK